LKDECSHPRTVSVEYLTRPFDVFAEAARVLKPGGVCAATFSNRGFPPKVIWVWPVLHEFEPTHGIGA